MTHIREHVENVILASLSKQHPGDLPDWMIKPDFIALLPDIERAIEKVLQDTHLPMFSDEDLTGFMMLKAHKLLRRQKYDFERSAYTFFKVAFKNMVRDLIRCQNSNMAKEMRWDVLDVFEPVEFDESLTYHHMSLNTY